MAYCDINRFHLIAGETIMACQRIEYDIKIIFAAMLQGRFNDNYALVKDKVLGQVLMDLERLDTSDGNPYFSPSDYRLLKEIREVRNWLVHKAYVDFMYNDSGAKLEQAFNKAYNKLLDFNASMQKLGNQVENVRIDILKYYGRI